MGNSGARLGMTIGFGILGAAAGDATGFAVGSMIGSIAGSLLFPVESPSQNVQGPRLEDLSVQTSTYGNAIPICYGTIRIAGNVIWSTGLVETANTESIPMGGGKGGGPESTRTTYTYSASLAIGLCRGPIIGIRRIWADDKLWFDFADPPVGVSFAHRLYLGTDTQTADPAMEAREGVGNVPGYRGLAYILFDNLQLAEFGNRIPNFHFEVVVAGSTTAHVQAISDGANTGGGKLAIDLESGLVWETTESLGRVRVYRPDTLALVNEITGLTSARGISYQPPYSVIKVSQFQDPTIKEVPPRMWLGANRPGLIGGGGYSIETRNYAQYYVQYLQGDWSEYYGEVFVDTNLINFLSPIQEDAAIVAWLPTNATVTRIGRTYRIASQANGGFGNPSPYNVQARIDEALLYGVTGYAVDWLVIADTVLAEQTESVYFVNWVGTIVRVESGSYNRTGGPLRPIAALYDLFSQQLAYDPFEDKVYLCAMEWGTGVAKVAKMAGDLSAVEWTVSADAVGQSYHNIAVHPQTGQLFTIYHKLNAGLQYRMWVRELDKTDGSVLSEFETDYNHGTIALTDFVIYPHSMFAFGRQAAMPGSFLKIPLTNYPAGVGPTLASVVQDLSEETGLVAADLDVTALTADTVRGYAIAQRMPARNAIEPLMRGYFFDAVESDYKVKFPKRGGASVATIDTAELGARRPDEKPVDPRAWTRTEENELPWQVDVRYLDVDSFYKTNDQYARRLIGQSKEAVQIDLAAVFNATEAKKISEVLLYNAWMDRTRVGLRLGRKYLKLDPTDVITIIEGAEQTTYRLAKVAYSPPNILECEAIEEDSSIYVMTGVGVSADPPAQVINGLVLTILYLLDLPALRNQDDDIGIYVAMAGAYSGWRGADLYRSTDSVSYTAAFGTTAEAATGAAETTLTWEGAIP